MSERAGGALPTRSELPDSTVREAAGAPSWSPWRAVVGFGVVSLAADMVYEGARSVTGYGMFAAVQGIAAVAGGAVAGELSAWSLPALIAVVAGLQLVALGLLLRTLRTARI